MEQSDRVNQHRQISNIFQLSKNTEYIAALISLTPTCFMKQLSIFLVIYCATYSINIQIECKKALISVEYSCLETKRLND